MFWVPHWVRKGHCELRKAKMHLQFACLALAVETRLNRQNFGILHNKVSRANMHLSTDLFSASYPTFQLRRDIFHQFCSTFLDRPGLRYSTHLSGLVRIDIPFQIFRQKLSNLSKGWLQGNPSLECQPSSSFYYDSGCFLRSHLNFRRWWISLSDFAYGKRTKPVARTAKPNVPARIQKEIYGFVLSRLANVSM